MLGVNAGQYLQWKTSKTTVIFVLHTISILVFTIMMLSVMSTPSV